MAVYDDLNIFRGETKTYEHSTTDADGTPICLTGGKIWFTVKKNLGDSDANAKIAISSAVASEIEIIDADNGVCHIKLTNALTQNLDIGIYVYDVQVKTSTGSLGTVTHGAFAVIGDVTRAVA